MSKIQDADIKSEAELIALASDKTQLPNTTKAYTLKSDSILETVLRKNNDSAVVDPTINDDVDLLYEVGSRWINTATDTVFICVDNTDGAAIWLDVESGGGVGSPSIYKVFDAEDEDITDFSNISITDVGKINGEFSYSVDSYPANFPLVTLNLRNKEKENAVSFEYTITSGKFKAVVKDNASNVLGERIVDAAVDGIKGSVAIEFFVLDTITGVQLFIEDDTSSTGLKIDDVVFDDTPFIIKNLININSISLEGNDGRTVTNSTEDTPFDGSGNGWTSGADNSPSFYTVQANDSVIQISGNIFYNGGTTGNIYFYKNGTIGRRISGLNNNDRSRKFDYTSKKGEFVAGDQISIRNTTTGTLTNDANNHWLTIVEQSETEHILVSGKSVTEHVYYDGFTALSAGKIKLKTERQNTASKLISVDNTSFTKFTALKECSIVASVSGSRSGGAAEFRVEVYDSLDALIVNSEDRSSGTLIQGATSLEYKLDVGDYVVFGSGDLLVDSQRTKFSIKAQPIEVTLIGAIPTVKVMNIEVAANGFSSVSSSTSYKTIPVVGLSGDIFGSVDSDQVTISKGSYKIEVPVSCRGDCDNMTLGFFDVDAASYIIEPIITNATGAANIGTGVFLYKFDVIDTLTFEVQTKVANASGQNERANNYTITKLK